MSAACCFVRAFDLDQLEVTRIRLILRALSALPDRHLQAVLHEMMNFLKGSIFLV